jgi:ATP-dependent DNA helicase RecG
MDPEDLVEIIAGLRRFGGEPSRVEAKSGRGGFPQSVRETLVAFANTDGGQILIGIDEQQGFEVVDLPEAAAYRDRLVDISRTAIMPALQIATELVELEGKRILVAYVPPTPPDQRPVYVHSKGVTTGAYLRTGDGDRRMTEAEIAMVYSSRTQPLYDREPVRGATDSDLDRTSLLRTLERARLGSAYLRDVDDLVALHRLGVLSEPSAGGAPTLAGLLAFGSYPQQFFPQLMVSVVVHPVGDTLYGARFVDNVSLRGSVPGMTSEALSVVRRHLSARAVIVDGGRSDHLDYPLDAIREAVVNALMHRDYSPTSRGTQVQIELFPDKLTIRSPGGLYGGVMEDDLGEIGISSSRNAVLANLLTDTYLPRTEQLVAENRASGIPTMITQARRFGLPRPVFESSVSTFVVTLGRSELLGPEVRRWLAGLRMALPTPAHEIAAAMMRGGFVTNAALREWGVDRLAASQVLRDLTDAGLAVKQGGRRYARYVLDPAMTDSPQTGPRTGRSVNVETALREAGTATAARIQEQTGLSRVTVTGRLNALIAEGLARAHGSPNSPRRNYEWVGVAPHR